jgi:hypothetical protein
MFGVDGRLVRKVLDSTSLELFCVLILGFSEIVTMSRLWKMNAILDVLVGMDWVA